MEEIFQLLDEEKVQPAIEKLKKLLNQENISEELIENIINNLNHLIAKSDVLLKAIFPNLLKFVSLKNDILRYSLILSLKPLAETEATYLVSFAGEYLNHKDPNARESMLSLLIFAANKDPEATKPILDQVIHLLTDEKDFVQKKAMDFIKTLGKTFGLEIEKELIKFAQSTEDDSVKEKIETILKKLVDIKNLKEDELQKKQLEVSKKVLDEKEKIVTEEEIKIKEEEIRKREELVNIKKETKEKDEELKQRERELLEKEQALKEKELKLKEAALLVEEKEKEIEEEKIRQKAEQLEKQIEINRKKAELDLVKKELEIKKIEEKKEEIIKEEKKRIEEKLHEMDSEPDDDAEYEEITKKD